MHKSEIAFGLIILPILYYVFPYLSPEMLSGLNFFHLQPQSFLIDDQLTLFVYCIYLSILYSLPSQITHLIILEQGSQFDLFKYVVNVYQMCVVAHFTKSDSGCDSTT